MTTKNKEGPKGQDWMGHCSQIPLLMPQTVPSLEQFEGKPQSSLLVFWSWVIISGCLSLQVQISHSPGVTGTKSPGENPQLSLSMLSFPPPSRKSLAP